MGNDIEMYLEKVLKKTNPEKYIEILEQDREDFAKEIVELNHRIDKAIEYIEKELSFNVIINGKENKVIAYNKAFENIRNILESSDEQ